MHGIEGQFEKAIFRIKVYVLCFAKDLRYVIAMRHENVEIR